MPIGKIKFEKLFPTVQYGNELFSMEGTVGPNETEESLYDEMHKIAMASFQRNNPHLAVATQLDGPLPPEPIVLPTIQKEVEEPTESLIELIERCTSWAGYNGLNTFSVIKKNEAERQAFFKKKKELGVIG